MPISHLEVETKKIPKRVNKKKILKIVLGVLVVLLIFGGIAAFYSYKKVGAFTKNISDVSTKTREIQVAVEQQDVVKAKQKLQELETSLQNTKGELESVRYFERVPIVKNYYKDSQHALNAAILGTEAGKKVADSIIPFGDILGLKGVKSNQKAEDKIKILVTQVFPSLLKEVDELENTFEQIKYEVDQINPDRYPKDLTIGNVHVKSALAQTRVALNNIEPYIPDLKHALEVLPAILGYKQEKAYFIWFQNDKELRPTGGFITAYGVAKVKDGKLIDMESDDIYRLDRKATTFEDAPEPLRRFFGHTVFPLRDSNLSPDFKISAETFERIYKKIPNQPKIDGIITIDTEIVRRLLEITGPITLKKYNETFSAENNPKYNIPDVVYKLELYAEVVLRHQGSDRKGFIGDLMDEMLNNLFNSKPEKFPKIFDTFIKAANEKHILFYFHDPKSQEFAEELNYAGRVKDFDGDYLHINNANFGGLKGNLYIKGSVNQDISIKKDGTVAKKIKVTLKNTGKADGWLNSVYRNWMRLYVPEGSKLIDKKVFSDFKLTNDLNYTVWESFSLTYPLGENTTEFTYELPFKVREGESYKLLIQKQPGIDLHIITRLNGKVLEEFDLLTDKEIERKI